MVLVSLVASCGGSSPTAENQPVQFSPDAIAEAPTTATVAIVLTDYAVDDYLQALATITSIELIGTDDSKQNIFEGEEVVDLLALRDELKLFAVNENVTPGDFSKIRMHASSMILVKDNGDDTTTEIEAKLVGNGKIDLNPRETITLNAGDVVFVSLDWDMKESLKLTEAGPNNTKVIMRPVVFVDVGTEPAFKQGLVRVNGTVSFIAQDFSYFRICSTEMPVQLPENPQFGDLCLDILTNASTGIFNPKGEPITVSDLMKNDPVSVVGLLRRSVDGPALPILQDENGNELQPTLFQVLAIVVEVGDTWARFRGTVLNVVDDMTSTFPFLADDDMTGTEYTGRLSTATRIFKVSLADGVTEIAPAELMPDDRALLDAVTLPAPDESSPQVLAIALMLARTPPDGDESMIGEIVSINNDEGTLQLLVDSTELCVSTVDGVTRIFEVVVDDTGITTSEVTLADLDVGANALVSGVAANGCYAADLIVAEGPVATPL